eukprot:m51a1_g1013 hypothetical protein (247) ;mRNA; f:614231-615257
METRVVYVYQTSYKWARQGADLVRSVMGPRSTLVPYSPFRADPSLARALGPELARSCDRQRARQAVGRVDSALGAPGGAEYLVAAWNAPLVPRSVYQRAKLGAVNVHPAPPEHPGNGAFSAVRALGRSRHGVTLHEMGPQIDCGKILRVRTFPVAGMSDEMLVAETGRVFLEMLEEALVFLAKHKCSTADLHDGSADGAHWGPIKYRQSDEDKWLGTYDAGHPIRRLRMQDGSLLSDAKFNYVHRK